MLLEDEVPPDPHDQEATIAYLGKTLGISEKDAALAYELFYKLRNVWDPSTPA
jgi:hypothetical protein